MITFTICVNLQQMEAHILFIDAVNTIFVIIRRTPNSTESNAVLQSKDQNRSYRHYRGHDIVMATMMTMVMMRWWWWRRRWWWWWWWLWWWCWWWTEDDDDGGEGQTRMAMEAMMLGCWCCVNSSHPYFDFGIVIEGSLVYEETDSMFHRRRDLSSFRSYDPRVLQVTGLYVKNDVVEGLANDRLIELMLLQKLHKTSITDCNCSCNEVFTSQ